MAANLEIVIPSAIRLHDVYKHLSKRISPKGILIFCYWTSTTMLASLMSLGISGVSSTLYFVENARRVAVPHLLILCFVRNKKALKLSFEKTYFRRLHITRPAYLQLQIDANRFAIYSNQQDIPNNNKSISNRISFFKRFIVLIVKRISNQITWHFF